MAYEIEIDSQDEALAKDSLKNVPVKSVAIAKKGRGFSSESGSFAFLSVNHFDVLKEETSGRAQRSIEGWVIFVTGLHEESTEEEIKDLFSEYGKVRDLRLNLDHRTGYVKGYALVEYQSFKEANEAIKNTHGKEYLGNGLECDFAFIKSGIELK